MAEYAPERTLVTVSVLDQRQVADSASAVRQQLIELMDRHQTPLSNFLTVLLRDRDAALDCAQDTFLRAYQHLSKGKPVTAGWLWTVGRNRAVDELKRRNRVRADYEDWDVLPDGAFADSERTHAVRQTLAQLAPEDREVLYLFTVDRFQTAEIAAMLHIRPEAVRMRLSRARQRFRRIHGGQP